MEVLIDSESNLQGFYRLRSRVRSEQPWATIRGTRGMTLIEILAVIVLLGLIMGVVAKGVFGKADAAKAQTNKIKMEKLKSAIEQFRLQYNKYPNAIEDLVKPPADSQGSGEIYTPFADQSDLKDVWNYDYIYRVESGGRSFSLSSYGADGVAGGDGPKQDVTLGP